MKLRNIAPISRVVPGAAFTWQTTVKRGRALGAALTRVLHLRDGGITARWYSATMSFGRFVVRLQRQGGWVYVVKYLKACSVLLQQASGGQRIDATQALGAAVSRTHGSGIPRVIPAVMRKSIRSGDPWTIRIWLSFFQLYRVIEIPGKLKLGSITSSSEMKPSFLIGWINFLNRWLPSLFREAGYDHLATLWISRRSRGAILGDTSDLDTSDMIGYVATLVARWITFEWGGIPCTLKPKLLALFKSGPNTGGAHERSWVDGRKVQKRTSSGKLVSCLSATNTGAIFTDIAQWLAFDATVSGDEGRPSHLYKDLYPYLKEWLDIVQDRTLRRLIFVGRRVIPWVRQRVKHGDYNPFKYPGFGRPQGLGKLGYKLEPAGKIRVFAMVDSLTQCIMRPLHDLLFKILRRIETDGTFNQMKPAQRLINLGYTDFWSLDLSSATDRFPLALQQALLSVLIGPRLAELWGRILIERWYLAPPQLPNGQPSHGGEGSLPLLYGAGQPMGALTSWAMFSLTHHCLVQYAAFRALGDIGFYKAYALLGDDIVIANHAVALEYQALLLEIGVEYGLAKSLISSTGSFEFAKRTFARGKDVSGISLLAIGVAKADPAVLEQILSRFGTETPLMETLRRAAKVLGYGFRALARLPAVLDSKSRLQGLAILLSRPGSPWGLQVIDWLLQWQPGVGKDYPQEVIQAIGERLWDSLVAKTQTAIKAHLDGLAKVIYPDSAYGGNIDTWVDKDNLQEESWNIYVVIPLVAELKVELRDLQRALNDLSRPDLDNLNEIWERISEIRDAIAAIPSVPNFFERNSLDFGGARRSALINVFRQVRSWLNTELARKVSERCLAIKAMAMAEPEGPPVPLETEVPVLETPMDSGGEEVHDLPNPVEGPVVMLSPRFGMVVSMRDTPSGPRPHITYVLDGVHFTEEDIHLDGILHNESMPYSLVLRNLPEPALGRVKARLRDEQHDEM